MSSQNDFEDGHLATVDCIVKELEIDGDKVQKITNHFVQQMQHGLKAKHSYQIPSFVTEIPTGHEKGLVLAVDLGGTNCRVCAVNLHGDSTFDVSQRKHVIPPELRVNESYKPLFEFIALKIGDFLHEYALEIRKGDLKQQTFKLGFTFSFTCEQTSLSRGTLVHWDKGWDIPRAVNQDPCSLLQAAIDEIALPVRVCVLANDAVGTLLTKAYTAKKSDTTLAAIILGTGTNAAYVERISNIARLEVNAKTEDGVMVINTEWGSWDDALAVLPQTRFDKLIDQNSSDPGCGLLEKMVSGMYLGELLRLMLVALIEAGELSLILDANSPAHRNMGIETAFLTRVSAFGTEDTQGALAYVMETLMANDATIQDLRLLQTLAKGIIARSARLVGAGLAAILIQSGRLQPTSTTPKTATITQAQEVTEKPATMQESSTISSFVSFIKSLCGCIVPDSEPSLPTNESSYESEEMVNLTALMDEEINVAVDGSLFEFHVEFEELMRGALRGVAEVGRMHEGRIKIELTKDGSGTGAALMAAVDN
ncbi:hypothetical protein NW768_007686 [Fusarium equiseti]|uniref:Phosphotransferase n=1 Tax=Fusarium equiseti TaxID=61235 RepID=A0ABQ8R8A4_FUSEQ|nr:hypothetical protein NW768_007686 [Fusarium equiseti]